MGLKYQVTLTAETESRVKYKFIWLQFVSRMNSNYMVEGFREKKGIPRVVSSTLNIHFDNIPFYKWLKKLEHTFLKKNIQFQRQEYLSDFTFFF